MLRWLLTFWRALWCMPYLYITTQTDIALHAYLLWSTIPPKKPTIITPRRGGWCLIGDLLWPMPLNWLQQQEPGDTLTHTFIWPDWPPAITRYAMVFPSSDPQALCSTSPIWTLTSPALPLWEDIFYEPWSS